MAPKENSSSSLPHEPSLLSDFCQSPNPEHQVSCQVFQLLPPQQLLWHSLLMSKATFPAEAAFSSHIHSSNMSRLNSWLEIVFQNFYNKSCHSFIQNPIVLLYLKRNSLVGLLSMLSVILSQDPQTLPGISGL